jgi:peptidoglycan/LPS O-acetylase OafA/YrhL
MKVPNFKALHVQSNELLHLDLLRFIAASGIVVHHSKEYFFTQSERAASGHQSAGLALFVDLFFVISGYVIAYVYANRMSSFDDFGRFVQRRIGRLVPLHWLTLVISIAMWLAFLKLGVHFAHIPSFRPECIAVTAALLHAGISCEGGMFNGQSWTISAEMGMYLAFPLFSYLGWKSRNLPLLLGAAVLALILISMMTREALFTSEAWGDMQPYLRAAPSFIIGVGLWFSRDWLRSFPLAQPILVASLIGLVFAMMRAAPGIVVLTLIYLTTIAAIAADLQRKSGPIVVTVAPLGQLTYSIYMWHGLFITVLMNGLGDKFLHARAGVMAPLALVTYALILGCSYISYLSIETPARRWVDRLPLFTRRAHDANPSSPELIRVPPP